jgi:hypothetical protein
MDLALGGTPADLAGKLGSSNVDVKIAALVKAFKDDFSFFITVLFSSELLFILDLPESLYSNVRKSRLVAGLTSRMLRDTAMAVPMRVAKEYGRFSHWGLKESNQKDRSVLSRRHAVKVIL